MAGITAREIAARLGLSASAVSLALNGKPGVSEQTRKMVIKAAEQLGYGGIKSQMLASNRKRICFVFYVNRIVSIAENTSFSTFVLQGVESAASALGYSTQVRYLRSSEPMDNQAADICREADGIILLGTDITKESLPAIEAFINAAKTLSIVVVDSMLLSDKYDSVGNDNYAGTVQAVNFLIQRGCTRIGYLRSRHRILNFEERESGLRYALVEAGLKVESVVDIGISFDNAIVDMENYISQCERLPDAFFAENDVIAAAAVRALKSRGIKIPEDVSVVGFDDIPLCELADPALTTVHAFKEQLGSTAVNLLSARLSDNRSQFFNIGAGLMKVIISTELRVRNSVK